MIGLFYRAATVQELRGEGGAGKQEERKTEAGEGGSKKLVNKNNFTGFLQPRIPQRGQSHGWRVIGLLKKWCRAIK